MKTIRRLVFAEVLRAVGFVLLGFLGLFFFSIWSKRCKRWEAGVR